MGLKAGINLFGQCTKYAKVCGKEHILQFLPQKLPKINSNEIKICPNFLEGKVGDVVELANFPEYELSSELGQRLINPSSKQQFIASYKEFWLKRKLNLDHEMSTVLHDGDMIHGTMYDIDSIESTLKTGILSGEIGMKGKQIICEDGETFGCADFFTVPKEICIKDYFTSFIERSIGIRKAPEFGMLPRQSYAKNRRVAYIVDSKNFEQCCPILHKNSATPISLAGSTIENIIHQFPDYENLKSVLVGVPANFISKIIVGPGIENNEIIKIKNLISELKLNIHLYDVMGKML